MINSYFSNIKITKTKLNLNIRNKKLYFLSLLLFALLVFYFLRLSLCLLEISSLRIISKMLSFFGFPFFRLFVSLYFCLFFWFLLIHKLNIFHSFKGLRNRNAWMKMTLFLIMLITFRLKLKFIIKFKSFCCLLFCWEILSFLDKIYAKIVALRALISRLEEKKLIKIIDF